MVCEELSNLKIWHTLKSLWCVCIVIATHNMAQTGREFMGYIESFFTTHSGREIIGCVESYFTTHCGNVWQRLCSVCGE